MHVREVLAESAIGLLKVESAPWNLAVEAPAALLARFAQLAVAKSAFARAVEDESGAGLSFKCAHFIVEAVVLLNAFGDRSRYFFCPNPDEVGAPGVLEDMRNIVRQTSSRKSSIPLGFGFAEFPLCQDGPIESIGNRHEFVEFDLHTKLSVHVMVRGRDR